jgi:caffeoyl-CoA O-methyltransferase
MMPKLASGLFPNVFFIVLKRKIILVLAVLICSNCFAQGETSKEIDERVSEFLSVNKNQWDDLNIPYEDGKVLFDLIIKNKYTSALEIGTSTGHSTIWIAWALSKTGGKLTTIEIDKNRQKIAIDHLKKVGLSKYVEFKLADAHQLVKELSGPFDFVFSDADKGWYLQYFQTLDDKIKTGGCYTAHNVREGYSGTSEFLDYVRKKRNYETTIDSSSSAGISISVKKTNMKK